MFPYHGLLLDYSRDTSVKDRGQVTMNNSAECNECLLDTSVSITAALAKEKGGPFGVTTGQSF